MCVSTVPEAGDLWPSCCVVLWYHTEKGQKRRKRREKGWKWEMDGKPWGLLMMSQTPCEWHCSIHEGVSPTSSSPFERSTSYGCTECYISSMVTMVCGGREGEGVHPNHVEGLGVWRWNFVINLFPMAWVPWEWTGSQKNQGLKSILQNLLSFQI